MAIQVLTQSRTDLIARSFAALHGAKKAILHLYNTTAPVRAAAFRVDRLHRPSAAPAWPQPAIRRRRLLIDCNRPSIVRILKLREPVDPPWVRTARPMVLVLRPSSWSPGDRGAVIARGRVALNLDLT